MSEQYFTRPNVQPVITNIGTTPEQRQMSTSEFKAKFDEMPEAIQQYIKETLLTELDAFKQEFMTHQAEFANTPEIITNENGTAFKYPSGALVCWQNRWVDHSDLTAGEYTKTWTFPVPFLEGSLYFFSYQLGVANTTDAGRVKAQTVTRSSARAHDSATYRLVLSANLGSGATDELLAIGMWK
jgi:hypothetical protein